MTDETNRRRPSGVRRRVSALLLSAALLVPLLSGAPGSARAAFEEPAVQVTQVPARASAVDETGNPTVVDTTVEQYVFTFSALPRNAEDLAACRADSPYKAMALLLLAFRTWTPKDESTCLRMLDLLTDTGSAPAGSEDNYLFSEYNPWISALRDRMTQNAKYRYIGNAYLGGATPENNYAPDEPFTVTVRQSAYDPYQAAGENTPELKQVLIRIAGDDNDRYALFYEDEGVWRVYGDNWMGLLADVQTPAVDRLLPPEIVKPAVFRNPQSEPEESVFEAPARASAVDEYGSPTVIDTTVKQHTFTFSTVPTCYEDIIQYKLDSPCKTMALLFLAFRTWTPENKTDCLEMMDYLTCTNADSGKTDSEGRKLSRKCSEYQFWTDFVRDRMMQNDKYRYIGNAYLGGAMPANGYTPTEPITVTVRESVYQPYQASGASAPALYQVLTTIPGAENDRYALFYQDQRGDWRVYGDNWQGLLTDVIAPGGDIPLPPEPARSDDPRTPQSEPETDVRRVPGKAVDENGEPIDIELDQYAFTFSTVPACYEDIVQYRLDSPYKTMALLFLTLRTWTPEHPEVCAEMLDYLTSTAVPRPGAVDGAGRKLSYAFSEYQPWVAFLRDRMTQNDKYRYIGNAYLGGAAPENGYTPDEPLTVTVRQSAYDPYRAAGESTPELKQVLVSLAGDDSDRYALFYQDQRGDWRVFGDNWMGLLADVREPAGPPAIRDAALDGNRVTFRTVNAGDALPWVASYGSGGALLAVFRPEQSGGVWEAALPNSNSECRIFLLDPDTQQPLCKAVCPEPVP